MQIQLDKSMELFRQGLEELSQERGFEISAGGILVKAVEGAAGKLKVEADQDGAVIYYDTMTHFYRGFMHLLQYWNKKPEHRPMKFQKEETVYFDHNGAMLDCSRNAVPRVATVKKYIRDLASLGMNTMMLYTEDTYQVEGEAYIGAFRGRYSYEEMKECDDYAALFGIELVPCIQALAHLHTVLRYSRYEEIRDTEDILLVGSEAVYELLDRMIASASKPFRSRRIHLGMDEAHSLGLGKYLEKNGYCDRFEIMNSHLKRVGEICEKYQLEPMIWSDMYFRLSSPTGDYYDLKEDSDLSQSPKPPETMGLVYWDYYHDSKEYYHNYFRLHKQLAPKLLFAGASWTWNGIAPNLSKMFAVSQAALTACQEDNVREVICTFWQDNGGETPLEAGNTALALFAEYGFSSEVSQESVQEWVDFLWNDSYRGYLLLDRFDTMPGTLALNAGAANPSKFLLYQDVLLGLFDEQVRGMGLSVYYGNLARDLEHFLEEHPGAGNLFRYYAACARFLSCKAEIGIDITAAYRRGEKEKLRFLCGEGLSQCGALLSELREYREKLWFQECKPFGYEILDIRLGGLQTRIESAKRRIGQYLTGTLERIEELEEERLPYFIDELNPENKLCSCNLWQNIISAGNIDGV